MLVLNPLEPEPLDLNDICGRGQNEDSNYGPQLPDQMMEIPRREHSQLSVSVFSAKRFNIFGNVFSDNNSSVLANDHVMVNQLLKQAEDKD